MDNIRDIVASRELWYTLRAHLLRSISVDDRQDEQLAFVLASYNRTKRGVRLVAREILPAAETDLIHQSPGGISPTGEFVARAITRCRQEGWSLIEVHSHPFDSSPHTTFSGIDWANDRRKMPSWASMIPRPFFHATMVIGQNAVDAHYYDRETGEIRPLTKLTIVGSVDDDHVSALRYIPFTGSEQSVTSCPPDDHHEPDDRYDRQLSVIGARTQETLSKVTVAVVGLGGLGSFVALELAYLGIGHLVLIDADHVEQSNLNRLLGAKESDVGRAKVDVFDELIKGVHSAAQVTPVHGSIMDSKALEEAKAADIVLGCVDSHGARLALNHLAIRYLIPYLDAGTGVRLGDASSPTSMGGQVQLVAPGVGCLECRGFIDPQRAAFDLATPETQVYERQHGYGAPENAPSVISLNGVVGSILVAETIGLLRGSWDDVNARPRMVMYDALAQKTFTAVAGYSGDCVTCGADGVSGVADLAPLEAAKSTAEVPVASFALVSGGRDTGTNPEK